MVLQEHAQVLPKSHEAWRRKVVRHVSSRNLQKRLVNLFLPSQVRQEFTQGGTQDQTRKTDSPRCASLSRIGREIFAPSERLDVKVVDFAVARSSQRFLPIRAAPSWCGQNPKFSLVRLH